ncbi:restriction endonuclease subunit S [Bacillus spizizenii]|uniref:restriction endonuclease subunit S n=1 Tax=Bacillus inaquosorum TaxID=483913 RepID=UPI002282EF3A|nr:restriction endonuclease subunit S [Bacillus inaquosorum]MCY7758512.1 restriction endonuclease subunit S [Bacillus inaquosorum]MCY7876818.1 restriction endonuclease subunit S [Bacillus spizizenii]MCY8732342.1 restriction endonuclease subunit S [Bacillus inaquosorum]
MKYLVEDKELSQVADVIDSLHKTPDYVLEGYPMVRVTDIKEGNVDLKNTFKVDQATFEEFSKKYKPTKGDILMTRVGTYGNMAFINTLEPFCLGQNTVVISPKGINNRFLYYYLQSNDIKNQIESQVGGSTQKTLSLKSIRSLKLKVPTNNIQEAISSILGSLDDKIDLNHRVIETLEEVAKLLYKYWFIEFGPFKYGNFIDTKIGMIPEGWKVKKLKDIANITMGQSPKSEFYNHEKEGLPFHQGVKDFGNRFPTNSIYSSKLLRVAEEGDFLISVRAPVGRINIAHTQMVIGRGLSALSSKTNSNSYLLYTLKFIFSEEDKYGSGTIFNAINKGELEGLDVIVPEQKAINEFEFKVSKLDALIKRNYEQNSLLIETREYLLPRLLTGEIDVSDAVEKVKEVISNEQPEPSV